MTRRAKVKWGTPQPPTHLLVHVDGRLHCFPYSLDALVHALTVPSPPPRSTPPLAVGWEKIQVPGQVWVSWRTPLFALGPRPLSLVFVRSVRSFPLLRRFCSRLMAVHEDVSYHVAHFVADGLTAKSK